MENEHYTTGFYEFIRGGSARSAAVIVPLLLQLVSVRSVVDVGCGDGSWLSTFLKLGVSDVLGVDGSYVDQSLLQVPPACFQPRDLGKPFRFERTFDLAISLEVAEHLPAGAAGDFVESLARLAPFVLFSAAIPFQGGVNHINEQWPDFWAALFHQHGFVTVDCIRRRVWNNDAVEFWYAQNMLLFVRKDHLEANRAVKLEFERTHPDQLRLVHPRLYLDLEMQRDAVTRSSRPPLPSGVKEASRLWLNCVKNSVRQRLRWVLKRGADL